MSIIDSKGRLFGKLSILDLAAAAVILLVIVGVFFFPGTPLTANLVAQTKQQPVEVKVLVRGLSVDDFDGLVKEFKREKNADIVIRNQPAGKVEIISTETLARTTPVPQPDGSVKALPDPRPEIRMIRDVVMTVQSNAQITEQGVLLGSSKQVKIGSSIQLQGSLYDFSGTVISINPKDGGNA